MYLIRPVEAQEVLGVLDSVTASADTKAVAAALRWQLWWFDRSAIAAVTAQLPNDVIAQCGRKGGDAATIQELNAAWIAWLACTTAPASAAAKEQTGNRAKFHDLVRALAEGRSFTHAPIVYGANKLVLDGKHRLFAAYQFTLSVPTFGTTVYWAP